MTHSFLITRGCEAGTGGSYLPEGLAWFEYVNTSDCEETDRVHPLFARPLWAIFAVVALMT